MGTIKTTNIETITGSGTLTLGQSGETISIPSGATLDLSNATQTGVGGTNTPAFQATISGSQQPISSGVTTKLNFTVENFDTNSAYDAPNSKFTVPSEQAGKYFINATPWLSVDTTYTFNYYYSYIYKNGSAVSFSEIFIGGSGYIQDMRVPVSTILDLSVGDYIEIYANGVGGTSWGNFGGTFEGYKIIE